MVQNEIKSNENPIPRERYLIGWIILEIIYLILCYAIGAGFLIIVSLLPFIWIFIFFDPEKEKGGIMDLSQKNFSIITGVIIIDLILLLPCISFKLVYFLLFLIISQFFISGLLGLYAREVIYQKRHKNTYAKREPEKKLDMKKPMSVKDRKREVIYAVLFAIGGCILLPLIFFMNEFSNITYVLAIIISCIIGFAIIFRALQVYKRHSRETNQKRIDVRQ